eukprot:CAMPEP_0114040466 /NCGR_PEP_ID=MMETSP1339-20121228/4063_1 /TAXON_ID=94617 /ORGANISM="Fibrocapsa japonica" /LENGTH=44 /assembly_acc=CAM_ASM_000762
MADSQWEGSEEKLQGPPLAGAGPLGGAGAPPSVPGCLGPQPRKG